VCPISPLIECHTDKTVAKQEIKESIEATKEGATAVTAEIAKAEDELAQVKKQIEEYNSKAALYDKKIALAKQIKLMQDQAPEIPEKPEELEVSDTAEERAQLNAQLKAVSDYEDGVKLAAQIEALKTDVDDYEALVKATSEKGPVRTGVISKYMKVFEDVCNERSKKVRPEIDFKFVPDNGVVVLMNNGKGAYLPYESLSGGERAYMLFVLMDMLNALCGTNILLLDELSVIDSETFNSLLDIVLKYAGDYDHILLAAVDHKDTVDSIDAHGIPRLDFGICAGEIAATA
jgi:DNA repair exonuclease SbcCD ATPase subunit